jgi:CRISPR system Cascade subunit CasB
LLGGDTEPSTAEHAIHAALTLYALHQQSKSAQMHQSGVSLGQAVRRLGQAQASEEATLRRFHALGTASSFEELVYHLRGLVTQLRGATPPIPLDYGQLAVDLRQLQAATRAPAVRLRWGRDYHRRPTSEKTTTSEQTSDQETGDQ